MTRWIPATRRSRTVSLKLRTLSPSEADSGMMLFLLPASIRPTVTTAVSRGLISRDTTVCKRITVAAAITTGSIVVSGSEP